MIGLSLVSLSVDSRLLFFDKVGDMILDILLFLIAFVIVVILLVSVVRFCTELTINMAFEVFLIGSARAKVLIKVGGRVLKVIQFGC